MRGGGLPGGGDRQDVDSFLIGAQYTFGGPPR